MSIRFYSAWNGYHADQIVAGLTNEAALVASGIASYDLDGELDGVISPALLSTDANNNTVLVGADGSAGFNDAGLRGASPSASAAVNAAAINASLAAGGLVTLAAVGTYMVDATLVFYSNTRFVLGDNVIIKLAAASNVSLVKNASSASTGFTSVAGITSSADIATVNWVGHGLAVGDYFTVLGMDQNDYAGVWKVLTAPDADTITYYLDVTSATSPCTGTIVGKKCDSNIILEGGTYDWNQSEQVNPGTVDAHAINMANMANYFEYGVRVINNLKYSRNLNNTRDTYCKDGSCYSYINGADGWHVIGPQRGSAVFENLTGTTGDDFIGLTTGDVPSWTAKAGANDIEGDINLVRILNANVTHGNHSIVKLDGSTVSKNYVIKTVEIDGLHGTTVDTTIFALVLGGAFPLQDTRVNNLLINNVTANVLTAGKALLSVENTAIIDNASLSRISVAPTVGGSIVRAGGTSTITKLDVSDIKTSIDGGSSAVVDMAAGATYGQVLLQNYRVTCLNGATIMRFDGALTMATAMNGFHSGNASLMSFSGTGSPSIYVQGCTTGASGGGVKLAAAAYLFTKNWYHNSGAAAVNVVGGANEWHGEVVAPTPLTVSAGTLRPNGPGIRIATALATYKLGFGYYDTTLNKLRVGGATAWETVTSA